jgi:VanZ family protein
MSSTSLPSDSVVLPLRHPAWWLGIGALMLLSVAALLLLPLRGPDFGPAYSDKLAHTLVFCILMTWFSGILQPRYRSAIFASLLLFGTSMEWLQSLVYWRSAEVLDLVFNAVGLLIGWALARAGMAGWAQRLESGLFGKRPT